MKSEIVRNMVFDYEPVAVVWSNTIPDDAFQFREGRFGCILYLFAEAARRGKIAAASRETVVCPGGRAALGFGVDFDTSEERLHHYAAMFSMGLQSASDRVAYRKKMDSARKSWRSLYEFGERRHCNAELAREWIAHGLPRYDIPYEYVLFKPLGRVIPEEKVRAVIFLVSPVELAGLVTLAGSVMRGTDPIQVPQGADCNSITAFAYAQADTAAPRAVLGMLGVDGREVMRKRFRDDILTFTVPAPLFKQMESKANDCIFQIPSWKKLVGSRD
ncbi:MAG: DUF169 domain-containing protein [Proteobacteria bacterium]|nr:DUF169 domain-containing protein [Pseudomonadota bacterium]